MNTMNKHMNRWFSNDSLKGYCGTSYAVEPALAGRIDKPFRTEVEYADRS